jgi:hypothetical protein
MASAIHHTTQKDPKKSVRRIVEGLLAVYWDVPHDFEFLTGAKLDTGWQMWLCGLPGNQTLDGSGNQKQAPI